MKKSIFSVLMIFIVVDLFAQIDTDLTDKTVALYNNLNKIQNSNNFLFGQEFFNSFRFSSGAVHGDETYSDSHTVTGSHPAVLGSGFHYYLEKDATERSYHTDAVKWAYQQGYAITFDWHISARNTTSYECASAPAALAKNIANGNTNGDRDWYLAELDKVIKIINEDLVVGNDTIPIVFRPLHEMNGGWFWWGTCSGLTDAEYKLLYQLTVDYVKERTKSVLFCWSPNAPFNLDRYPGDEYVDVIGVDAYEVTTATLRTELGKVVDYAQAHNKVAVFSETGDRNSSATAGLYWKNVILPGILDDPTGKSKKIAWVLTWINSAWSKEYVPHPGSSSAVRQSFTDFKNSPNVLFGDEVFDLYTYIPDIPVSVLEDLPMRDLQLSPVPTDSKLSIILHDFRKPTYIQVFDSKGHLVIDMTTSNDELIVDVKDKLNAGIFLLRAAGRNKIVSKKFLVR